MRKVNAPLRSLDRTQDARLYDVLRIPRPAHLRSHTIAPNPEYDAEMQKFSEHYSWQGWREYAEQ